MGCNFDYQLVSVGVSLLINVLITQNQNLTQHPAFHYYMMKHVFQPPPPPHRDHASYFLLLEAVCAPRGFPNSTHSSSVSRPDRPYVIPLVCDQVYTNTFHSVKLTNPLPFARDLSQRLCAWGQLHCWTLTLNYPRTHKCVQSLHKSIRIYMGVILGANIIRIILLI